MGWKCVYCQYYKLTEGRYMEAFEAARINMVKSQILPQRISNKLLVEIISDIPRHIFVPEDKQGIACIDGKILVGNGRYLLPPMIFSMMLEALDLQGNETVLDIACGTGYSSAILAKLCKKITALESSSELASKAHQNFNKLGIKNIIIINNILSEGHREGSPYDAIVVNGAVNEIPEELFEQLNENGKLVAIISKEANLGKIVVFTKKSGKISNNEIFETNLPIIEDF